MQPLKTVMIIILCLWMQGNHLDAAVENLPGKKALEMVMQEKNIPGLSMVIIENAEVVWHMELGVKNSKIGGPINCDTLFEAASLSKPVFAYGVLKMVESGQLNLDQPLVDYLPHPDIKDDKRLDGITARMVLSHTSGFPNWRPKNQPLKIYFQPNERFSYSGEGYLYLQHVIEHISGLSLENYLRKIVFIPLGMNHSTFIWVNDSSKAAGHVADGTPLANYTEQANAAFTLHTNALDYAKFVIALMKGIGLKADTIDEMLRPQIRVQADAINTIDKCSDVLSDTMAWGLGWGVQRTKLGDAFWHWGDNTGFKSYVVGFRGGKRGLIIFTNSANGLVAIKEIMQQYLGVPQPAFDWLEAEYARK